MTSNIKNRPVSSDLPIIENSIEAWLLDPNQLAEISPWEMDFRQIEAGKMQAYVRVRPSKLISCVEIVMNKSVHQIGKSPDEFITLGIPLQKRSLLWQGKEVKAGEILRFGSGNTFESVSDSSFRGYTISVDKAFFLRR